MDADGVVAEDGRLVTDLAATLEPRLQDALNHPTRRDALRVLHGTKRPQSVAEVLGKLPPLTRGEIGYHLQVLQDSGCVTVTSTRPGPAGRERLFKSEVRGSEQALLVLRAAQASDRKLRQRKRGSSSLLTMFRIPQPSRSIRLNLRRQAEPER
jgi:DNA-binding transcriptional ArsR family regulator